MVFAHSLGTLLTYDLFLHPPQNRIIRDRYFITCGCQIGPRACAARFGGRLETVAARDCKNWYNENDDVLVVPFTIYANNYQTTIETTFELAGVGDHDAVEYIRHGNAQNKVWREIAGLPKDRAFFCNSPRVIARAKPKACYRYWKILEKNTPPLRWRLTHRGELFLLG